MTRFVICVFVLLMMLIDGVDDGDDGVDDDDGAHVLCGYISLQRISLRCVKCEISHTPSDTLIITGDHSK